MALKKVSVLFSRRAAKDLEEIYHYLSLHAPQALQKIDQELFKSFRRLEFFPESGSFVKEFTGKKYREVLVFHYRIIYRYPEKGKKVQIFTIRHGKRYLPSLLY